MIGQTLGHYRIESKLGAGGMGVVYRAFDTHLDRWVAIKVLRPDVAISPDRKRRFVQEAKAASALNHPNIVHVYDINTATLPDGPVDFIAMEFVSGQTLDRRIGRNGMNVSDALKYGIQVADALARAHGAGIIHRDLKPANIIVSDDGRVKLLDFGLAKLAEIIEGDPEGATATIHANESAQTQEGMIVGTVAYMSPEQAEGKKLDARSDIFSFGSVLYEAVTGRQAFRGDTKVSTLSSILHKEPQPAREIASNLPGEFDKIHNLIKTGASAFGFSRDSTTLYAIRRGAARRWELAAFEVPRGEKKAVALDLPVSTIISGFSMHLSGKSFATSVGVARFDIWLLEGFPQPHHWFSWR